jgi:hypothetical protein
LADEAQAATRAILEEADGKSKGSVQQIVDGANRSWIQMSDAFESASGAGGFHDQISGFVGGLDKAADKHGSRIGVGYGYGSTWLTDGNCGTASQDAARAGVYGSTPLRSTTLSAALMYGRNWDSTYRATGVGDAIESHAGNEIDGGVQATFKTLAKCSYKLTPTVGLNVSNLDEGGFTEKGSGALAGYVVSGGSVQHTDSIVFGNVDVTRSSYSIRRVTVTPDVKIGYQYDAGAQGATVNIKSVDGTAFTGNRSELDPGAFSLAGGITAGTRCNSVFLNYNVLTSGNWHSEDVSAGLLVTF